MSCFEDTGVFCTVLSLGACCAACFFRARYSSASDNLIDSVFLWNVRGKKPIRCASSRSTVTFGMKNKYLRLSQPSVSSV